MSYDGRLRLLKRSFIGGGEGGFYFRMLDRLQGLAHVDWLDIGIGRDGSSVAAFADHCRARGQTMAITGVDPDAVPGDTRDSAVRCTIVRTPFEMWTPTTSFDVINADQSLYYLQDLPAEIERMIAALRPGGLLIATCWLRDDTLHRIRQRLFSEVPTDLVGEGLQQALEARGELEMVERAVFETQVDVGSFLSDASRLEAAIRVISRGVPIPVSDAWMRDAAAVLGEFPALAARRNLALCFRRRS